MLVEGDEEEGVDEQCGYGVELVEVGLCEFVLVGIFGDGDEVCCVNVVDDD